MHVSFHLLDVGCGTGSTVIWFAKKGFDATGIDFSAHAIEQARKNAIQEKNQLGKTAAIHCSGRGSSPKVRAAFKRPG